MSIATGVPSHFADQDCHTLPLPVKEGRGCWTDPERVQIERISFWCDKCPKLEFDGGQTDEGDPWCIVYDREREEVVLYIARIDRRFVMARQNHPQPFTTALLSAAINVALDDLGRGGNYRRTA